MLDEIVRSNPRNTHIDLWTHITGPPATVVYSTGPQFLQPTTNTSSRKHSRYAKLEYSVHSALSRLKRCLRPSRVVVDFVILDDKVERLFSNEAGEVSSPYDCQYFSN